MKVNRVLVATFAILLAVGLGTPAFAQITITEGDVLSIEAGGGGNKDGAPFIHKINPETGVTISSVEITLDGSFTQGEFVNGGSGIAFNPDDGKIYALLKISIDPGADGGQFEDQNRHVATIDPLTGIATLVGDTGAFKIASLTFNPGTLFSVDLDFDDLSTVSTVDGSVTNLCDLEFDDGAALARNSNDGKIYFVADNVYQRIDDFSVGLGSDCGVTDISVSGDLAIPAALLFIPTENFFLVGLDKGKELWSLTTTSGADLDFIGDLDHQSRGLTMILDSTPPPPTPDDGVVGGELLPIDSTALLLAGLQTSAIWMLPVLAGVAGSAFGILYIKSRRN